MKDWRKASVGPKDSIRAAIEAIDSNTVKILLVVDGEDRLLGTVTDGDVRRGLLRGVSLDDPVDTVMNSHPVSHAVSGSREEALQVMQEKMIGQIPILNPEGRVVELQTQEELQFPAVAETWVVLMVGGLGTRLRPLTEDTPKPMLKVGDKPLLETIVRSFARQGFRRFFLCVNYRADLFKDHFGDGAELGIRIDYLHEDRRLGTAGALRLLPEKPPGPVIVMNGDLLTSVDFRHLLDFHNTQSADATMCVRDYHLEVPYGVAVIDDQRLVAISEKPRHHFFVNAGIYVLSPESLEVIPPSGPYHMTELFQALIDGGQGTTVFPIREYWLDIGRVNDLERAQGDFDSVFG